jgi:DNA polymerase-3 subunit gamma/tau
LIAASAAQRQRLTDIAAGFSEEDLTRYLQLSLDLFKDLQTSLQPRFHLELGLVRLVQAGRLLPIEQALADLANGGGDVRPAPKPAPTTPAARPPAPPTTTPTAVPGPVNPGDERGRLHAHLVKAGLTHQADAVENSRISVVGAELRIVTAKTYTIYFNDKPFAEAVREVFGRPLRIQTTVGETGEQAPASPVSNNNEDDATRRALANTEVQRFREVFGGEIRKVRNLKE